VRVVAFWVTFRPADFEDADLLKQLDDFTSLLTPSQQEIIELALVSVDEVRRMEAKRAKLHPYLRGTTLVDKVVADRNKQAAHNAQLADSDSNGRSQKRSLSWPLRHTPIKALPSYPSQLIMTTGRELGKGETTKESLSLDFREIEAATLAEHFSLIEFQLYKAIRPEEFVLTSKKKKDAAKWSPNMESITKHFNLVGYWVVSMILNEIFPKERALMVGKFIKIAMQLRKQRNFNTLMAIYSGLRHSAIYRLKETFAEIPKKLRAALDDFDVLLSHDNNFEKYRDELASVPSEFSPNFCCHLASVKAPFLSFP